MTDVTFAIEAKSDQLNAVDIIASPRVIKITRVEVKAGDQPVSVYFEGDHGRPWRPSKGMLRILAMAWGADSSAWVGRHAQLYHEPGVVWGGKQVGGIRISALSDIQKNGITLSLATSRNKREPLHVKLLEVSTHEYPAEQFEKGFPFMCQKMQAGEMTLQEVIAQCQKTGNLTSDQIKRLEAAAPIVADCEEEGEGNV